MGVRAEHWWGSEKVRWGSDATPMWLQPRCSVTSCKSVSEGGMFADLMSSALFTLWSALPHLWSVTPVVADHTN